MQGQIAVLLGLVALALLPADEAWAESACQETCQAERTRLRKQLEDCLREVDPRPPDRAAKMRLHCRQRYSPPRCDGLPPCAKPKETPKTPPGLTLGPMVFSATRRGAALPRASYAAGDDVFLRVDVEVRPKPKASRISLRMDLRLLATGKEGQRVIARWDSYAEEQRLIDPDQRGFPLRFTMHGGAKLPADTEPGRYLLEAEVAEQISGFRQKASGGFEVRRARTPR